MKRESYNIMESYEDSHWWFIARRKIIKHILDKLTEGRSINNVLEIGCGSGGNLELLKNYGNLYALEYDDNARNAANQRHICEVLPGSLPNDIPFNQKFDLVCALDVIEHIENDKESIMSIASLLNTGGTLLITVPAFQFLWSAHDVANNHKRRYTKSQLCELLVNTDLELIYSSYFNTFLFPPVLIVRFMKNLLGVKEQFEVKPTPPINNAILQAIFSAERIFIPRFYFPFGVSVLLVARKIL